MQKICTLFAKIQIIQICEFVQKCANFQSFIFSFIIFGLLRERAFVWYVTCFCKKIFFLTWFQAVGSSSRQKCANFSNLFLFFIFGLLRKRVFKLYVICNYFLQYWEKCAEMCKFVQKCANLCKNVQIYFFFYHFWTP